MVNVGKNFSAAEKDLAAASRPRLMVIEELGFEVIGVAKSELHVLVFDRLGLHLIAVVFGLAVHPPALVAVDLCCSVDRGLCQPCLET